MVLPAKHKAGERVIHVIGDAGVEHPHLFYRPQSGPSKPATGASWKSSRLEDED
jgi:hypothetical protein